MIKKYFTLIFHLDIQKEMPQILDRLREYEQSQPTVTKALTFTSENIGAVSIA